MNTLPEGLKGLLERQLLPALDTSEAQSCGIRNLPELQSSNISSRNSEGPSQVGMGVEATCSSVSPAGSMKGKLFIKMTHDYS